MTDAYSDAMSSIPGSLSGVVLKKLAKESSSAEISDDVLRRLDRLVDAPGQPGKDARIYLAANVSNLFERAPTWTSNRILPIFEWSSSEATDAWKARKYSNYIGSPELFGLTKKPLLEMFGRPGVVSDDMKVYAGWLIGVLIANKRREDNFYPLTPFEVRAALRRAGVDVLSSVGHRLAIEMEGAGPEEKVEQWQTVIGPIFRGAWPLDVELQSRVLTFKLVQILRATGKAFSEAADLIIPFIQPDERSVYSIVTAADVIYASAPRKVLDLVAAVVGEAAPGSVYRLGDALSKIQALDQSLASTRKFQRLSTYASA